MENNAQSEVRRFSKVLKISLWVVALFLLGFLALVGAGQYLQTKFPEQLKALVHEKSQGEYQLEFDKLTLSLLKGTLFLENVKLKPDTQARVRNGREASPYLIQARVQQIRFSGMNLLRYVKEKEISIDDILIDHPDLVLYQREDTLKKEAIEKSLYDRVPDFLKGAKLGLITVNELSFAKREIGTLEEGVNQLSGLSFSVEDVLLSASALSDSTRVWFSKDIRLTSKNLNYTLVKERYVLNAEELLLSTKTRSLDAEVFTIIPQDKDFDFTRKLGVARSRYEVRIPKLHIGEVDFKKWEVEGKLFAQSFSMDNGTIDIFNDKKMPAKREKVIQNAPHLALQRLEIPILIDSLKVDDFELHYREFNPKSTEIGDVFFTHMGMVMTNITNDSLALSKNHWAKGHFNMNFLGHAKLTVDLNLNLVAKDGEFTYKGALGSGSAQGYNRILVPLAMVKADKGYFNSITFDVKANERGSHGRVQVLYKDLKVTVLVKEDSGKIGRQGLFSFLANSFLISPNNPIQGLPARVSHFTYTHSPYHSFFNLMWKSVFEGIKENVIETKEQKRQDKIQLKERKKAEKEAAKRKKKEAKG